MLSNQKNYIKTNKYITFNLKNLHKTNKYITFAPK